MFETIPPKTNGGSKTSWFYGIDGIRIAMAIIIEFSHYECLRNCPKIF